MEIQDKKALNVMTSCTEKFSELTMVLIYSLSINHPESLINFYILHTDIGSDKLNDLTKFCDTLPNVNFNNVKINEDLDLWGQLVVKGRYSSADIARYLWLSAHKYLPLDMDRILYLDAFDILVTKNITEFYYSDFDDAFILAAIELNRYSHLPKISVAPAMEYFEKTHDIETIRRMSFGLINSGSIVLNLNKFRKEGLSLVDYVEVFKWTTAKGENVFGDQGLFSLAYGSNHKLVDLDYNYRWFAKDYRRGSYAILHYTGFCAKPFNYFFDKNDECYILEHIAKNDNKPILINKFNKIHPWYLYYNELWWDYCKQTPVWCEYLTQASENTKNLLDRIKIPNVSANIDDGIYNIINKDGLFLTVIGELNKNGSQIAFTMQNMGGGAIFQQFRFVRNADQTYTIFSMQGNKSVEVRNSSYKNGADLSLWDNAEGYPCKRWVVVSENNGYFKFVNCNSGKVINYCQENATAEKTKVNQWSWTNSDNQKYKLNKIIIKDTEANS